MAKFEITWDLPEDLSSVKSIIVFRAIDDPSLVGLSDQQICEYIMSGTRVASDSLLPFFNRYIDDIFDYGEYIYGIVAQSFSDEYSLCIYKRIEFKSEVTLRILNHDPRGEILVNGTYSRGSLSGSSLGVDGDKTNYEFTVANNSRINLKSIVQPKVGWIISSITHGDKTLTSFEIENFYLDRDIQIEINYAQKTYKLKVTGDTNAFHSITPNNILTLPAGYIQTLAAFSRDCFVFKEWTGGPSGQSGFDPTDKDTLLTIDGNYEIHAHGEDALFDVSLTVNNDTYGAVSGEGSFFCNQEIFIKAQSSDSSLYRFKRWEIKGGYGNIINDSNEPIDFKKEGISFKVNGPVLLEAVFKRIYTLRLTRNNLWGKVRHDRDDGIRRVVRLDEEENFINIKTIANAEGVFVRWAIKSGASNISNKFEITEGLSQRLIVSGDVELEAIFAEEYELKIGSFLSSEKCRGGDCGKVLKDGLYVQTTGSGEYHSENNRAEIFVSNIDHGYEFVKWEIIEGVDFIQGLQENVSSKQIITLSGDVEIRAVIKLSEYALNFSVNDTSLGRTLPELPKTVTVRDVVEISGIPLNSKSVFYKWEISDKDKVKNYGAKDFDEFYGGNQKLRVLGDLSFNALFLDLHEINLTYTAYGTSKDSKGANTLESRYNENTLIYLGNNGQTSGSFTELDLTEVNASCFINDCQIDGTKPGVFGFAGWTAIENETPANIFSETAARQVISLQGDITLEALFRQKYQLKIYNANSDTSTGVFSGQGIYKANSDDAVPVSVFAEGQISSIDGRLYEFDRWEIVMDDGDYILDPYLPLEKNNPNHDFNLMSDLSLRAYFLIPFDLTLSTSWALATLSVSQDGDGTYRETEEVEINAIPSDPIGYEFSEWTLVSGSVIWGVDQYDAKQRVKIIENTELRANFQYRMYNFSASIQAGDEAKGSVVTDVPDGSYNFTQSITITITATPGYKFKGWNIISGSSLALSDDYEQTITLIDDLVIEAVFIEEYLLTLNTTDDPSSLVQVDSIGGAIGSGEYDEENYTASIEAIPNEPQYRFSEWIVNGPANYLNTFDPLISTPQSLDLTGDLNIFAVFLRQNILTLSSRETHMGKAVDLTIKNSPYEIGEDIQLQAFNSQGYQFKQWNILNGTTIGLNNGSTDANPTFQISTDVELEAEFEFIPLVLTVIAEDATLGSVTGGGTYNIEDIINISATPLNSNQYRFKEWKVTQGATSDVFSGLDGSLKYNSGASISIRNNVEITAIFEPVFFLDLTQQATPNANANIEALGLTIENTGTNSGKYLIRESNFPVSIKTNEPSGFVFSQWLNIGTVVVNSINEKETTISQGSTLVAGDSFTVEAQFIEIYELLIQVPKNQGNIVAMPLVYQDGKSLPGVNLSSGDDNHTYSYKTLSNGSLVKVQANPLPGYSFLSWTGSNPPFDNIGPAEKFNNEIEFLMSSGGTLYGAYEEQAFKLQLDYYFYNQNSRQYEFQYTHGPTYSIRDSATGKYIKLKDIEVKGSEQLAPNYFSYNGPFWRYAGQSDTEFKSWIVDSGNIEWFGDESLDILDKVKLSSDVVLKCVYQRILVELDVNFTGVVNSNFSIEFGRERYSLKEKNNKFFVEPGKTVYLKFNGSQGFQNISISTSNIKVKKSRSSDSVSGRAPARGSASITINLKNSLYNKSPNNTTAKRNNNDLKISQEPSGSDVYGLIGSDFVLSYFGNVIAGVWKTNSKSGIVYYIQNQGKQSYFTSQTNNLQGRAVKEDDYFGWTPNRSTTSTTNLTKYNGCAIGENSGSYDLIWPDVTIRISKSFGQNRTNVAQIIRVGASLTAKKFQKTKKITTPDALSLHSENFSPASQNINYQTASGNGGYAWVRANKITAPSGAKSFGWKVVISPKEDKKSDRMAIIGADKKCFLYYRYKSRWVLIESFSTNQPAMGGTSTEVQPFAVSYGMMAIRFINDEATLQHSKNFKSSDIGNKDCIKLYNLTASGSTVNVKQSETLFDFRKPITAFGEKIDISDSGSGTGSPKLAVKLKQNVGKGDITDRFNVYDAIFEIEINND
jgi:hypothetical protein